MFANVKFFVSIFTFCCCLTAACHPNKGNTNQVEEETSVLDAENPPTPKEIIVGAERTSEYFPLIRHKAIATVVNQTSTIGEKHLVDSLLSAGMQITKIFAPEHGFRGTADAGEQIIDGIDVQTQLAVTSLYGAKKKPSKEDLEGIDIILFDIQDVGARFYTYISSMSYLMEACAEHNIPIIVLDRPNPNGHYVDGPVLKKTFSSFVGLHPIPVVHGMTVGEYAQMVNGEGWLKNQIQCKLTVIPCDHYDHTRHYELPIKPSPNLPNIRSIYLYPSICFFEGTDMSVGRGTNKQFQVLGAPDFQSGSYEFKPVSMAGAKYPKHENKKCKGYDLTTIELSTLRNNDQIQLKYLIDAYENCGAKNSFFSKNNFFNKLAGNDLLMQQIIDGLSADEIRASWKDELTAFKIIRQKYLLYKDFE